MSSTTSASRLTSSFLHALYYSTQTTRTSAFPARILGGGLDPLPYNRFGDLLGDPRHHLATHRHLFESTQNISTSFDPKSMHCNSCTSPHPVLWSGGGACSGEPKCFVLSDQCFPPALPVGGEGSGGDCLALILIEGAQLVELGRAFLGLNRGFDVPVGTVVVLSSVSHLGRVGDRCLGGGHGEGPR
jgi:hypothetical protein